MTAWSKTGLLFEQFDEVIDILDATFRCNLLYRFCGLLQKLDSSINTLFIDEFR